MGNSASRLQRNSSDLATNTPSGHVPLLVDCRSLSTVLSFLAGDEISLVRTSTVCRHLSESARKPALWQGTLRAFFDDVLPPMLEQHGNLDPLTVLRDQVAFSRVLREEERKAKQFVFPKIASPKDSQEWFTQCDEVVAEMMIRRGCKRSRPGHPYYGCSGGAYTTETFVYGHYATKVTRNGPLLAMAKKSGSAAHEELAEHRVWCYLEEGKVQEALDASSSSSAQGGDQEALDASSSSSLDIMREDYDYAALKSFSDWKLDELRLKHVPNPKSTTPTPPLRLSTAFANNTKSTPPELTWSPPKGSDVSVKEGTRALSRVGLISRLNAGIYGGAFSLSSTWTSIGVIYSLDCALDGSHVADYSAM